MAITPLPFNPQNFFNNSLHYASQARGQFSLTKTPPIFLGAEIQKRKFNVDSINNGIRLLTEGVLAISFTTPSFGLMQHDGFSYTGPTKAIAHTQQFGDLSVEFLMMGKTVEEARSIFYVISRWHEAIAGARRSGEESLTSDGNIDRSDTTPFDVEYYDNYIAEAETAVFGPYDSTTSTSASRQHILNVKYTELYPTSIQAMNFAWSQTETPISFTVTFSFYYAKTYF